jgi:ParB family chromosome partitioning protein
MRENKVMAKHNVLGRGLDALWSDEIDLTPPPAGDAVVMLDVNDIDPNKNQPRTSFNETALNELAESIANVGVLSPIIVRKTGSRYSIIAGERRWRATRVAGLASIPAIIRDWDAVKRLEAALIENLQRDDLSPAEEAAGIKMLMEQCGYTQEEAAGRLGRSRPAVANLLRLLSLPKTILNMLADGRLTMGHARALVAQPEGVQSTLADLAAREGWSVRQLERACAERQDRAERPKPKATARNPQLNKLEDMARDTFGLKAELRGDTARGQLVISYYSVEDLQRIWDLLEGIS